jgi:hypothetical protein
MIYYDWQRNPNDRGGMSPNLLQLRDHLLSTFGGQYIGGYNPRTIAGTNTASTHLSGAALDWRWGNVQSPGREVGRVKLDAEVLPFLIGNAEVLGVQMIMDYPQARTWKIGRGWAANRPGSLIGQSWAQWLHIETHPDHWSDRSPIAGRFAQKVYDPSANRWGAFPTVAKGVLKRTDRGGGVQYLNDVLRVKAGQATSGHRYTDDTAAAVRNIEAFFGIKGRERLRGRWVGPEVWAIIDMLAVMP